MLKVVSSVAVKGFNCITNGKSKKFEKQKFNTDSITRNTFRLYICIRYARTYDTTDLNSCRVFENPSQIQFIKEIS